MNIIMTTIMTTIMITIMTTNHYHRPGIYHKDNVPIFPDHDRPTGW